MTIKDYCSDIRAMFKIDNGDIPINDRLIYKETMSTALLLIKREMNNRKLVGSSSIYTVLPCLSMEEVPLATCCDYNSTATISRSRTKLPTVMENLNGLAVEYVADVETRRRFNQTTPLRYSNILDLGGNKNKIFFWFKDGYLYVSSPTIKKVSLSAVFEEPILLEKSPCDCETETISCAPVYTQEIKVPSYLLENVKQMVYQKFMSIYFQIPTDKTDDDRNETSR